MNRNLTSNGYGLNYRDIDIDISAQEYYECGDHRCEVVYSAMVKCVSIQHTSLSNMFQEIDERLSG